MNFKRMVLSYREFAQEHARQSVAIALSLLLVPFTEFGLYAQAYAPLDAVQLNQLVAPIALYPDSLVAQILTASTYPQQINDAEAWMRQYGGMPPDQLAAAVNAMPWDPSVKALTAFPSVLENTARNAGWTAALGNAYYNQPGDVMNAVQAMRLNAQQAGVLRTTVQHRVYYSGGLIIIEPVNPALVYVPYYNPWLVYGPPISPWGGYYVLPPPRGVFLAGVAIGFGVGIGVGLFAHYGWGYHAWAPNWNGGVVVYNHTTYISRSTTVINRGNFGAYNRGVYEHGGAGVPGGFHPAVTDRSAAFGHPGPAGYAHGGPAGAGRPGPGGYIRAAPPGGVHQGPVAGGYRAPAGGMRPQPSPAGSVHQGPVAGGYRAPAGGMHPQPGPAARPQGMSHPSGPAGSSRTQSAGVHPGAPAGPAGGGYHAPAGGGHAPGSGGHPGGAGPASAHHEKR